MLAAGAAARDGARAGARDQPDVERERQAEAEAAGDGGDREAAGLSRGTGRRRRGRHGGHGGVGALPGAAVDQALHHARGDGVVRAQVDAAEVQAERLAGGEVEHHRAGVAAEGGAVVLQLARADRRELPRREALLVVDRAEDRVHQLRVGDAAVAGGIADNRHLGAAAGARPGEGDRAGARPGGGQAEEGHVRAGVGGDPDDLAERGLDRLLEADLLEEVDPPGLRPRRVEPRAEDEARIVAHAEGLCHVAVGDDHVGVDQPAGADPVVEGVVLHLDPPDRRDRRGEQPARGLEPTADDVGGVIVDHPHVHHAALDRQHRPAAAQDDQLVGEVRAGRGRLAREAVERRGRGVEPLEPLARRRARPRRRVQLGEEPRVVVAKFRDERLEFGAGPAALAKHDSPPEKCGVLRKANDSGGLDPARRKRPMPALYHRGGAR